MLITKIFFDLDETLTHVFLPTMNEEGAIPFSYEFESQTFSNWVFKIRDNVKELIKEARDKVGHDNVYILTASVRSYATSINIAGDLGFNDTNIICREDLKSFKQGTNPELVSCIQKTRNILIDNLPARDNKDKISFLNVKKGDYFQVYNYYAYPLDDDNFVEETRTAIKSASKCKTQPF